MTWDEARSLQAALALSGHYLGRIDGRWGRGSAAALMAAAGPRPTEEDAFLALGPLIDDVDWLPLNSDTLSVLLPGGILRTESDNGDPYYSMASPSRDLIVRVFLNSGEQAGAQHIWLRQNRVGAPYDADTPAAYITSGRLANGDTAYLWTPANSASAYYMTVLVQWAPRQAHRGRLIVASLSTRYVAPLTLTPNGYLHRIAEALAAPRPGSSEPPRGSASAPEAEAVTGSGTGFHVSSTAIVTAAHVVEGCRAIELSDGTRVVALASDPALDLAILLSPSGSPDWLQLGADPPRLGATATAIGYPFSGIYEQGVTATGGNISALRGLSGSSDRMLLSAPVQPGNSGGPLIDRLGRIIGVVIAKADEGYARERAGTAPENMNVAVQVGTLRAFLDAHRIDLSMAPAPIDETAFADGLPDAIVGSVVQIRCLGA